MTKERRALFKICNLLLLLENMHIHTHMLLLKSWKISIQNTLKLIHTHVQMNLMFQTGNSHCYKPLGMSMRISGNGKRILI